MSSTKFYTGVGTRYPPHFAVYLAGVVAVEMYNRGLVLRSGAARGMDRAFEDGHDEAWFKSGGDPLKEIWLPEKGFEKSTSPLYNIHPDAYHIARRIHPNWKACDTFSRNAHARNIHQVLGKDLKTPSVALLCYTDGGEDVGGTRTAIVFAKELGIPVFNFGNKDQDVSTLIDFIDRVS